MKRILFMFLTAILFSSCVVVEQEDLSIPQAVLPGIWKLNGYASSNYKVEITPDGYLYWFNYNDDFNRVEEFELDYNQNYNSIRLYHPGYNQVIHQFTIYKQANGRLYFDVSINGYDANGKPITNIDTYYQM
jgi:hypothetical protein